MSRNLSQHLTPFYAMLMSLSLSLFFALSIVIDNGYRYGAYASILFALTFHLISSFVALPNLLPLTAAIKRFSLLFITYFLVACALSFYHQETFVEIDQPSRYALTAIILLCISRLKLHIKLIWLGLTFSAFTSGILASIQVFILDYERAEGYLNPIFFGEISLLLGAIILAGLPLFKSKWLKIMICLAALSALLASLLSGTRGGWIALPFLILILVSFNRHIHKRDVFLSLGVIISILAVIYLIPQSGVATRIDNILLEYQYAFAAIDEKSAIGHRIELWKAALNLISHRPILGWGEVSLIVQKNVMIDEGLLSETIRPYTHLHSLYLDRLARYGLIGLTTLLLSLFIPLGYYTKHVSDHEKKPYCLAGILLVSAFLVFSLTDVLLDSEIGLLTYLLLSITLISNINQMKVQP